MNVSMYKSSSRMIALREHIFHMPYSAGSMFYDVLVIFNPMRVAEHRLL